MLFHMARLPFGIAGGQAKRKLAAAGNPPLRGNGAEKYGIRDFFEEASFAWPSHARHNSRGGQARAKETKGRQGDAVVSREMTPGFSRKTSSGSNLLGA